MSGDHWFGFIITEAKETTTRIVRDVVKQARAECAADEERREGSSALTDERVFLSWTPVEPLLGLAVEVADAPVYVAHALYARLERRLAPALGVDVWRFEYGSDGDHFELAMRFDRTGTVVEEIGLTKEDALKALGSGLGEDERYDRAPELMSIAALTTRLNLRDGLLERIATAGSTVQCLTDEPLALLGSIVRPASADLNHEKVGQAVDLNSILCSEIGTQATRLDRSWSWVLGRAWDFARSKLRDAPAPLVGEDGPRERVGPELWGRVWGEIARMGEDKGCSPSVVLEAAWREARGFISELEPN